MEPIVFAAIVLGAIWLTVALTNVVLRYRKTGQIKSPSLVVMAFSTHGCQGQIKEYRFTGYVIEVRIIHSNDDKGVSEITQVPAWHCVKIGDVLIYEN